MKITIPKAILATILFVVLLELIGLLWAIIGGIFGWESQLRYDPLARGIMEVIAILLFIRGIKTSNNLPQPTQFLWYLVAVILGAGFILVQVPLNLIYNLIAGSEHHITFDFDNLARLGNINLIALVILIPLAEELFFRAYLQHGLQKKYRAGVAIIVASVLFGAIHLPYEALFLSDWNPSPYIAYITFSGGLISGILYNRSGSIGPSIVMHITWNLVAHII